MKEQNVSNTISKLTSRSGKENPRYGVVERESNEHSLCDSHDASLISSSNVCWAYRWASIYITVLGGVLG